MVSSTTTNSGRRFIPMQYLDILWNRFEKYGEKTNRIIMGINDMGIENGWKSLITNGNPRGRFFFNYADLVLENPYKGENYKYYFQLQYFLYDRKEEILSINIEGQLFGLRLKEKMNTAVLEIPSGILRDQKEISITFSFNGNNSDYDKKNTNLSSSNYLAKNMEKMNNFEFKEFVQNFRDLFVIEVALLSEDSQYLRKELSEL
jgi:hypothetical protein